MFVSGRVEFVAHPINWRNEEKAMLVMSMPVSSLLVFIVRLYHVLVPFGKLALTSFRPASKLEDPKQKLSEVKAPSVPRIIYPMSWRTRDAWSHLASRVTSHFRGRTHWKKRNLMRHCSRNFILERCQETQIVLWNLSKLQREVPTKGIIFDSYLINKCMCPNDFSQKLVYTLDTP